MCMCNIHINKKITCWLLNIQKPIQIKQHIFKFDRFLIVIQIQSYMIFILDRMTCCLKTDPNTPKSVIAIAISHISWYNL